MNDVNSDVSSENDDDNDKRTFLVVLPYFEKVSKEFEKKLRCIFSKRFADIDFKFAYKSCKLSSFFSLKDRTPLSLRSKVVYEFSCLRDANITYIGETTRPLTIRVSEHLNCKSKTKTAVGKHIMECNGCKNHNFSLHDFRIVKQCSTAGDTRVHEALLIRKHSPRINRQLYLAGASFVLSVYYKLCVYSGFLFFVSSLSLTLLYIFQMLF